MIRFNCPTCQKAFTVRDQDAGRRAKCRACGREVIVPQASEVVSAAGRPVGTSVAHTGAVSGPAMAGESYARGRPGSRVSTTAGQGVAEQDSAEQPLSESARSAAAGESPRRIPMRIRRLSADASQMREAFARTPHIRILSTEGEPPELYRIEYQVQSLDRGKKPDQPVPRDRHEVEIQLTSEYPRISPKCRMLTSIFHPNIDPATICVGDHWAAGERLVDLVVRIGEMLAYQAYNVKSPLDAEAAMWADLNQDKLPIDRRDLRPADV